MLLLLPLLLLLAAQMKLPCLCSELEQAQSCKRIENAKVREKSVNLLPSCSTFNSRASACSRRGSSTSSLNWGPSSNFASHFRFSSCIALFCAVLRFAESRSVSLWGQPACASNYTYRASKLARTLDVKLAILSLLRLLLLLLPLPFLPSSPLILFATHWTSLIRAPFHLRNETNFATFFVPSDLLSNHASLKAQVEAKVSPNESSELINPSIKAELSRWHSLYVRARWWSACF